MKTLEQYDCEIQIIDNHIMDLVDEYEDLSYNEYDKEERLRNKIEKLTSEKYELCREKNNKARETTKLFEAILAENAINKNNNEMER